MTKICNICKKEKDINDFYFCKKYKNNHKPSCIKCLKKIKNKKYQNSRIFKCIKCNTILTPDKYNKNRSKYCNDCRNSAKKINKLKNQKKYYAEKYKDKNFRKKEAIRKALWWKRKQSKK